MKKLKLALAALTIAFLGACAASDPGINGKVVDKYIEDFKEHTVIMLADNGDVHHFTIDEDQWRTLIKEQRINSNQLRASTDD